MFLDCTEETQTGILCHLPCTSLNQEFRDICHICLTTPGLGVSYSSLETTKDADQHSYVKCRLDSHVLEHWLTRDGGNGLIKCRTKKSYQPVQTHSSLALLLGHGRYCPEVASVYSTCVSRGSIAMRLHDLRTACFGHIVLSPSEDALSGKGRRGLSNSTYSLFQ